MRYHKPPFSNRKDEIIRRLQVFREVLAPLSIIGKSAIAIDDGLASGYTMLAAIQSIRKRGARIVVAAAPVASEGGWQLAVEAADDVVCPIISSKYPFAVASFYEQWHDLDDDEVIQCLKEFKTSCRK